MKRRYISLLLIATVLIGMLAIHPAAYTQGYDGMGPVVITGGKRNFKWPVPDNYNLKGCFYDHRNHCAIDIAADGGTPVVASYPGRVVATYRSCTHNFSKTYNCCNDGFGNYVVLIHDYTLSSGETIQLYSRYSHLTAVSVSVGDVVQTGQKVGTIGTTGYSQGNHLDFQILYENWQPFRTYSIDPYANQLLELPENLVVTDSWVCGQTYFQLVKQLYSTSLCAHQVYDEFGVCTECDEVFDWESTFSASEMGKYIVLNDVIPKTDAPYSAATDWEFSLLAETIVSVYGSYTNAHGEKWYQCEMDGAVYYIAEQYAEFADHFDLVVSCTGFTPANNSVLERKSYTVSGVVTSENYPLKAIDAYLDGTKIASWTSSNQTTKSMQLSSTAINTNLKFREVTKGRHIIVLKAWDYVHEAPVEFHRSIFYMEEVSCNHNYTGTVTQAAGCVTPGIKTYTCSECEDSYTETIPAAGGHSYGDWETVREVTCAADGILGKTCTVCGDVVEQGVPATGHSYEASIIGTNCTDYEKIRYTCEYCQDFFEIDRTDLEWSAEKPAGMDDGMLETKTQYRYADYETVTSYEIAYGEYELIDSTWEAAKTEEMDYVKTWPDGYDTSHSLYSEYRRDPKTDTETETEKIVVSGEQIAGYLYYHWCGGENGEVSSEKTESCTAFHSFYSTVEPSGNRYEYENADCCADSSLYYSMPVYRQSYDISRKLFTYGGWGEWSDWSDEEVISSEERTVETRTMYRIFEAMLDCHTWDEGVVTWNPEDETQGVMTYTCTVCGAAREETVYAYPAGDLTGDGVVDNLDVEYLLWYTLFPESYPITDFADFDRDAVVDNKDVEYLLWYTLFPESYPVSRS